VAVVAYFEVYQLSRNSIERLTKLKTDGSSAQIQTDPLQNFKSRAVDEPCEIWRCMLHNPPWVIRRKHFFSAFLLDSLTLEDGTDRMRLQDNVALTADTRNANKIAFSKYEWKRSHTRCM